MQLPRTLFILSAIAAATLAFPRAALAYDDQWRVGVGVTYAALLTDPKLHGIGGGLHFALVDDDMFDLIGTVEATYHPSGGLLAMDASIGWMYKIDVLQIIPYTGLMIGGYDYATVSGDCGGEGLPDCHSASFGMSIPFGLSYMVNRDFAVDAGGRYHMLMGEVGVLSVLTAELRVEYTWGY